MESFKNMETDYNKHKRAEALSNAAYGRLEKSRSKFWKIAGDPPLLKPYREFLENPWVPAITLVFVACGFVWLGSVIASAFWMILIGLAIAGVTFMVGIQDSNRDKIVKKEMLFMNFNPQEKEG